MSKTHKLAQGLASLGRGPDKLLLHVSPKEVAGLQALANSTGSSLTINPKTGLPEAGVLDSILPMVAGAAAMYFSGGTLSPLMAGLLSAGSGAATKAATTGRADLGTLASGALAGYGGGALTGGIAAAGGNAAAQNAAVASNAAQQTGNAVANASIPNTQALANQVAGNLGGSQQALQQGIANAVPTPAAGSPFDSFARNAVERISAKQALDPAVRASNLSSGLGALKTPAGWSALNQNMTTPQKTAAVTAGLGAMSEASSGSPRWKQGKPVGYYQTSWHQGTWNPETQRFEGQGYGPGQWVGPKDYNFETLGTYDPEGNNQYAYLDDSFTKKNKATGGIVGLNSGGAAGRFVQGPGDGVSDSVPAVIRSESGNQPAALGDGEFVIDAHTVSKLGNGSSRAGAQRLYEMMDRVHRAKTRPGTDIKPKKYLPA